LKIYNEYQCHLEKSFREGIREESGDMAGRASRNKGAGGEREVIAILQPIVDRACDTCGHVKFKLRRNYAQRYEAKLYDVEGLPWMALEVKRQENISGIGGWWKQTKAATRVGQIPVLIYRQNNQKWKVRTRVPLRVTANRWVTATVTMEIDQWLVWLEQKIISEISR
jgi:hypothetical protein